MPKVPINYQNGLIYKLVCKDSSITDCYVGSTTNFKQRKLLHKDACEYRPEKYNFKVYQFMRENGGWDNWEMIEIEKYPCNDSRELHTRERYWLETLGATLNMVIPTRTSKEVKEAHKEHNTEMTKKYYQNHREIILNQKKQFLADNREIIAERRRKTYQKNRNEILDKKKQSFDCECGGHYRSDTKARHNKSMKHQAYLASLDTSQ